MLKISEKEPGRFEYQGNPLYLIAGGLNEAPRGNKLDRLMSKGVNLFQQPIAPFIRRGGGGNILNSGPYKYSPGKNIDNNWGGWDTDYFKGLQGLVKGLQDKKCFLVLIVFSTCLRKIVKGEGRFHDHLWNINNGGIFDANTNAVTAFYNLRDSKNIVVQKLLIDKILEELGQFDNIALVLQWEIFTGWKHAVPWAVHFLRYIKSDKGFAGPLGVGTHKAEHLEELSGKAGFPVIGLLEGHNLLIDMGKAVGKYTPPKNNPIISLGYHPREEGYYSRGKKERKCQILKPGEEKNNIVASAKNMVFSLKEIGSCSLPFEQYIWKIGKRALKDCRAYDIDKYNLGYVQQELFKFTGALSAELPDTDGLDELIPKYDEAPKPPPPPPPPPPPEDTTDSIPGETELAPEPSFWDKYKKYLIPAGVVVILIILLLVLL